MIEAEEAKEEEKKTPGGASRSFYLLSLEGEVLRRLENAEVGPTEEKKETSWGCLIRMALMLRPELRRG